MSAQLRLVRSVETETKSDIDKLVGLLRWVTRDGMLPADAHIIAQVAKVDLSDAEAAIARMDEMGVRRVIMGSEPHYVFTTPAGPSVRRKPTSDVAPTSAASTTLSAQSKNEQDVYQSLNDDMDAERALLWKIAIVCGGIAAATLLRQVAAIWITG